MDSRNKIFKDPIYGYITIDEEYCKDFIDTSIFQRLRRIEQTSMRILYPSAHHDRFAHSIGVFHLGKLAFSHIYSNSAHFFREISGDNWKYYKRTFEIACLMHDCGHSPFSHTFEHYFLYKKEETIKNEIAEFFKAEPTFPDDYDAASPACHEKISALLLLKSFSDVINRKYSASPQLAARMIMGCKYTSPSHFIQKFENKLISMLNGSGIDVDSLDYIQRDTWISGVGNVNIDYERLLSSLLIKKDDWGVPQIVFKRSVLSVLDNISMGRNFLYKWIYSHHIVNYEQYLLKNIIEKIDRDSDGKLSESLFSVDAFFNPVDFETCHYYLPSDDDLMYIIKSCYSTDSRIEEFLSRKYKFKALWKTYFEFHEVYFTKVTSINRMRIASEINKGKLDEKYGVKNLLCLEVQPKLKGINQNDFFIDIDGQLVDASKATMQTGQNLNYFILYVTPDLLNHKKKNILESILQLQA